MVELDWEEECFDDPDEWTEEPEEPKILKSF